MSLHCTVQAVVIGGGYIGLEMTASLRSNGLDTTVVLPQEHFLAKIFTNDVGEFYEKYYEEKGVHIRSKARAVSFEPKSPGSKQVLNVPILCVAAYAMQLVSMHAQYSQASYISIRL